VQQYTDAAKKAASEAEQLEAKASKIVTELESIKSQYSKQLAELSSAFDHISKLSDHVDALGKDLVGKVSINKMYRIKSAKHLSTWQ
jgi:predicted  nucleic acid-binding Zn-ribbon protein